MKILLYLLIKVFNFIKVDSRIIFAISVCFCMEIKNYSKCCCECWKDCLEDKESEEELEKDVVIEEEYKYDKNINKNVNNSKYGSLNLPNVPFFSSYNTVNHVIIPFAFELRNEYFKIFPTKMQKIVRSHINEEGIQENNVKIFFCYQYLITKILNKRIDQIMWVEKGNNDINEKILFRPHFFIAKEEIDKDSDAKNQSAIYCSNIKSGNICVVFNSEKKKILHWLVKDFSIHGGSLSSVNPSINRKIKDTSSNVEIYYSFVLELEKKIAAMTIHFFKCPDEGYFGENINKEIDPSNINTIADAINFAQKNNDIKVVEFLNSITK